MITVGDIIGILYFREKIDIQDENEKSIASYYFDEKNGEARFISNSNRSKLEILKRKVVEIGSYDICDMDGFTMWVVTGEWGRMTREYAIEAIKEAYGNSEMTDEIIKALDQEPALDKIRDEIERERSFQRTIDEYDIATGLRKALEIIDKYKESEDKEWPIIRNT